MTAEGYSPLCIVPRRDVTGDQMTSGRIVQCLYEKLGYVGAVNFAQPGIPGGKGICHMRECTNAYVVDTRYAPAVPSIPHLALHARAKNGGIQGCRLRPVNLHSIMQHQASLQRGD